MKERIFLSAPGLVCCAGQNKNELYTSCLNGYQGGMVMREFSGTGRKFPTGHISAELPEVTMPGIPAHVKNSRILRVMNAALEQIRPAVEKAIAVYGSDNIGVCLGSCDNGSSFMPGETDHENYGFRFHSASFAAEFISRKFGLSGPAFTIATVCASGGTAIMRGAELIQAGQCGAVIAGGADVVTETVFAGFNALEAVSDRLTNPFSKNRKGINFGEGAAFFLLEPAENSGIELLGAGESADAHHMTAPGPDGAGPAKAMNASLLDAGLASGRIGYVNLHGTGTDLNDKTEFQAMKSVFGASFPPAPPASSTKPITGHTLGAAGALEAAICWMVLHEQKGLPVHCWDGVTDEAIPFSPIVSSGQETPSICMSNNFGFGGCNVSLILGRGERAKRNLS